MGVDFHSVEELLERRGPCIVQGLETARHKKAIQKLSPAKLRDITRRYPARVMKQMYRQDNSPVSLMYRDLETELSPALLGIRWPLDSAAQAWDWKLARLHDVLSSPGLSCSLDVDADFNSTEPLRVAVDDLAQAICPHGCPETGLTKQTQLWLASGGVGHGNHFDAISNVFFHLHGTKRVVLCSPEEILKHGHLFPSAHPSARHSQVQWSSALPDVRQILDFPNAVKPDFNVSAQLHVTLHPGDALYMPAFWGHQTFPGPDNTPTISLAFWFSTPASNPYSVPTSLQSVSTREHIAEDFGSEIYNAMERARRTATRIAKTPSERWAALRLLAARVADTLSDRPVAEEHCVGSDDAILRWDTQRWRPLLGDLGVVVPAPLPASVCQSASQSAETMAEKAATELVRDLEWAAGSSFAADRAAVRSYLFDDFMDHLVQSAAGSGITGILAAEGLGGAVQLGALIASFSECSTTLARKRTSSLSWKCKGPS